MQTTCKLEYNIDTIIVYCNLILMSMAYNDYKHSRNRNTVYCV